MSNTRNMSQPIQFRTHFPTAVASQAVMLAQIIWAFYYSADSDSAGLG